MSTSGPAAASAEAVFAALCVLRPPEAGVSASLRRRLPALSPEDAERTLTLAQAPGDRGDRPPPDASPVARFLARQRRRAAAPAILTSPAAPFGALRLPTGRTEAAPTAAPADSTDFANLAEATARLVRWREGLEAAAAEHALELGVALAARLFRERLRCEPTTWASVLGEALDGLEGPVVLTIHPDDRNDVEAALGQGLPSVALRTDSALARGDVVVGSRIGRRDLRVRTRLAALLAGAGE